MSPLNKQSALVVTALLTLSPAHGIDLKTAPAAVIPNTVIKDTAPTIAPMMAAMPPKISGLIGGAGACVSKGGSVVVQGANFGTPSGKGVALGGEGAHVDLAAASWSTG